MQKCHLNLLGKQASELIATEMGIYNCKVKMEQVIMENSRLHLCIRQMTQDISRAREDRDRYWQEIHHIRLLVHDMLGSLQEAHREDLSIMQDRQSSDGDLLTSMSATKNYLKLRREEFRNLSTLLHQQMLDFSRRLGARTTAVEHSVSADL